MMLDLAMVRLDHPIFWALLIGWVLTLSIHEFAHGIVAHYGGDYTVAERGGLTLNPFQFMDPINSLVLPVIFMMVGGLPLPGGATHVRTDLLRSKYWDSAVSLAGPASNFIIFLVLSIIVHPRTGWVDPYASVMEWTFPQQFVGCMAFLQLYAVVLNLLPIPPLDGFGTIQPFLPADVRTMIMTPPIPMYCSLGFFFLIFMTPISFYLYLLAVKITISMGFSVNIPLAFGKLIYGL